jgi:hypothetical protein
MPLIVARRRRARGEDDGDGTEGDASVPVDASSISRAHASHPARHAGVGDACALWCATEAPLGTDEVGGKKRCYGRANSATTSSHSRPRNATMQLRSGKRKIDAYQPTFDPNLDIATVVFSHVQCVRTRLRLAQVSKLWRDASKLAAGYPRRFDLSLAGAGRFKETDWRKYSFLIDNDEALSLPREQVFELLESIRGRCCFPPWSPQTTEYPLHIAAMIGSVRMLKWARENDMHWPPSSINCSLLAAHYGHLPALQWLHENGCEMGEEACRYATDNRHWDCLQYLVDNKCPGWEHFAWLT